MEIKDKTALVTGSARGLGFAMIQELADRGAKCVVTDIDEAGVAEAVKKLQATGARARGIVCDVSDETSVENLFRDVMEKEGCPDIAVLNAGILRDGLLVKKDRKTGDVVKMSKEQWDSVIGVNLTGATWMVRDTVAKMIETDQTPGVIVNMSSLARHGNRGQSNYVSAKAALASNTVTWAREFARFGIRVGAIAPGMIETPMTQGMNPKAKEALVGMVPVGRIGVPEDIWLGVKFIIECDYFTGRVVDIDGGVTM